MQLRRGICLADFVVSGVDWHDLCSYFKEDELLRDIRHSLLESHTAEQLGEFLYKAWVLATEAQFSWFTRTFEEKLKTSDAAFFGKALKKFNDLCDSHAYQVVSFNLNFIKNVQ